MPYSLPQLPQLPQLGFQNNRNTVPDVFTDIDPRESRTPSMMSLPNNPFTLPSNGLSLPTTIIPNSEADYRRSPTGIWKPLDYLNRFQYAVMNPLRRLTDNDPTNNNVFKAIWDGLSGQERSSFSDVLGNIGWNPTSALGKTAKFGVSLAGDVLLDPTTYLTGGLSKLGKVAKLGHAIQIGDKTFDVLRDGQKIVNMLGDAPIAKKLVAETLAKKGIRGAKATDELVDLLNKAGWSAKKASLAPTLAGKYKAGQAGLQFAGKRLADVPGLGGLVKPVEGGLYDVLSKAGDVLHTKELQAYDKLSKGIDTTLGEETARIIGKVKRGLNVIPNKIKGVAGGARGAGQVHTINQIDQLFDILGNINVTDPRRIEALEILTSHRVRDLLPKGWEKGNITLEQLAGAIAGSGFSSGVSEAGHALRQDRVLETLKNWLKTDGSFNADEVTRAMRALIATEAGNIGAGVIPAGVAARRGAQEGIGYFTHDLLGNAATTNVKRSAHRYQTIWEALNGMVDDEVRKVLKKDLDAEIYTTIDASGKFVPVTAREILDQGMKPVTFDPNLREVLVRNVEKQAANIERTNLIDGISELADKARVNIQPLIDAGKIAEDSLKPLSEVFDSSTRAYLKQKNPALAKRLADTFVPMDFFLATKNIMPYVENPDSLTRVFKKFGDLIKPWLLVSPGFHTRNIVSSFLMTHAGGDSLLAPKTYERLKEVSKVIAADGALKNPLRKFKIRGKDYTAKELYDEFIKSTGSLGKTRTSMYMTAEEAKALAGKKNLHSAYMKVPELNRKIGNGIETNFRFAHWLNRLEEGYDPESAAQSVAKYFYDYADLSPSEKKLQAFVPFYCVPDYSEILTEEGWKHYTDVKVGDIVMTYNIDRGENEMQPVKEIAVFDYDGDLVSMCCPESNFHKKCTVNHRWAVKNALGQREMKETGDLDYDDIIIAGITKEVPVKDIIFEPVYYTGKIWCPRTANGTWFVRQGDSVSITGNTFLRKNLGANLGYLLEDPAYLNMPRKISQEVNIATEDKAKFPMDWLPEWIKDSGAVRLPWGQYARLEGWLPQMDFAKMISPKKAAETLPEMLHPMIKIPYELAANKNTFTGQPISQPGKDTTPFLGMPSVPNRVKHAFSWLRPVSEADKFFIAPAMKNYYTSRGAYNPLTPGAGAARFLTGLGQYDYDPARIAMSKYRELTDQMIILRGALRRITDPNKRKEIFDEIEKLEPRLKNIQKQVQPIINEKTRQAKELKQRRAGAALGLPTITM